MGDADLKKATAAAVMGFAAGAEQGCCCTMRVLIHGGVYEKVTEMIAEGVKSLESGSLFDVETA